MNILGIKSDTYLLWCFAIGFMVAGICVFCIKTVRGRLIAALVREDAFSEGSARSLKQLGCKGAVYRFALRRGAQLAESVTEAPPRNGEKLYYLKPDEKDKMLAKYGGKGFGLSSLLLTLLLVLIAAFVFAALLPILKHWFVKLT